jgi:glycerol-3-phosphate acyltransferase PlsY
VGLRGGRHGGAGPRLPHLARLPRRQGRGDGVFVILAPLATLCALAVFVLVVGLWRYVSLGSITAAAVLPLAVWSLSALGVADRIAAPVLVVASAGAVLIIFMHRANIGRLLAGKESKLK